MHVKGYRGLEDIMWLGKIIHHLDSVLKDLDSWYSYLFFLGSGDGTMERIDTLRVELRFLRTFLLYVENLGGADNFGLLIRDLNAGFKESSEKWIKICSMEQVDAAISMLGEKVRCWRSHIKPAYDHVESSYWSRYSPLSDYDLWMHFCGSLHQNLLDLLSGKDKLPKVVVHQLEIAIEMLGNLKHFLQGLIQDLGTTKDKVRDLLVYFGDALVCTAHISYLCWIDMDSLDESMNKMLSHLLKKLKPNTPGVIEGCLDALLLSPKTTAWERVAGSLFPEKYQLDILNQGLVQLDILDETMKKMPFDQLKNITPKVVVDGFLGVVRPSDKNLDFTIQLELFCRFLFFSRKCQVEDLNNGLGQLVLFVFYSHNMHKEDSVRMVLVDIIAALCEIGFYFSGGQEIPTEACKEVDPVLNKLLQKVMLRVMEVFLINLNVLYLKFMPTEKSRFDSLQLGVFFLRNFLGDNRVVMEPIWISIERVLSSVRSFSQRSHVDHTLNEQSLGVITEHHFMIRVFKMEAILEELLDRYRISLPSIVESQIENLYLELVLVRTFLIIEQGESEEFDLSFVKAVLTDAVSIFYSINWNFMSENSIKKLWLLLPVLLEKIKLVSADMKEMTVRIRNSLPSYSSETEGFGFMDFLLHDLEWLINSNDVSLNKVKHLIHIVHRDMEFLRSFLKFMGDQHIEDCTGQKNLASNIVDLGFQVECISDSFVCGDGVFWHHVVWLSDLIEDIRLAKTQASDVLNMPGVHRISEVEPTEMVTSSLKIFQIDDGVLDLADQNEFIIDKLTRGSLRRDIVSIVGMAGVGKTTLARKVYKSPSVTYYFHVRAWCYVSHIYQYRKILLEILGDIVEVTDEILDMSNEDLCMKLYQSLKGKKYLIIMDDMWSIDAWNDLKSSFPDDNNGSRILITSRLYDVVGKTEANSIPHLLRLLSTDESWDLLHRKLFKANMCPEELKDLGKQIASSCKGLPLALVAISGLLQRADMTPDRWKHVAESLSSLIASDPESRCMEILELSYKHLPNHLKPCFLYMGAFMEDKEIPARKLKWLWVAEGFVECTGMESAENVAEEYLTDLIGRSLVIPSKRGSNGGVKACRVHDMLRSLCLLKCKEVSFLEHVTSHHDLFESLAEGLDFGVPPSDGPARNPMMYNQRRLTIYSKRNQFVMSRPSGPHVHSLLHFATSDLRPKCPYDISFIPENFRRLRVLDMECLNMGQCFPRGMDGLVRLRYLALSGDVDRVPESIADLKNLQTLVLIGLKGIVLLPHAIWGMEKLQHLRITNGAAFSLNESELEISSQLKNLVSLSTLVLSGCRDTEDVLRRLPRLRMLKCMFSESRDDHAKKCNQFPKLDFLKDLESLKVTYSGNYFQPRKLDFPLTLRELSLSNFRLPWNCISEIGKLPNVEVLKLLSRAFDGAEWEMNAGEFLKLKFLKLDSLNIAKWVASSDTLPNLQHLVVRSCRKLKGIPSEFGDIHTLEVIEIQMCEVSVEESVQRIKLDQLEMGNEGLKILIKRAGWDL